MNRPLQWESRCGQDPAQNATKLRNYPRLPGPRIQEYVLQSFADHPNRLPCIHIVQCDSGLDKRIDLVQNVVAKNGSDLQALESFFSCPFEDCISASLRIRSPAVRNDL